MAKKKHPPGCPCGDPECPANTPPPVLRDEHVLEWCPPGPSENWDSCVATHWLSTCGRYRVTRLDPVLGAVPDPVRFGACYRGPLGVWYAVETDGSGRPVLRRSLAGAFHALESYHREKSGLAHARLSTNAAAMVAAHANSSVAPELEIPVMTTKTKTKAAALDAAEARTGEVLARKGKGKKAKVGMGDVVAKGRAHLEGKAAPNHPLGVAPKARKKPKAPVVAEPADEAVAAAVAPTVADPVAVPEVVAPVPSNGKLSQVDAAAKVLAEEGIPVRVGALIEKMASRGYWSSPKGKTPQNTLYSALLRDINVKGDASRFRRTSEGFKLA